MTEGGVQRETERSEARWTDNDLRLYLLANSFNSIDANHCLESKRFPRQTELPPELHAILNQMRELTLTDGHEYWTFIGANETRTKVMALQELAKGDFAQVPSEVISERKSFAKRSGIPYVFGDAHSHPRDKGVDYLLARLEHDRFSSGDLYHIVAPYHGLQASILAGPHQNMAVFRTQETELAPSWMGYDLFKKIWENHGWQWRDNLGMNIAISRRHKLALYHGEPNKPLVRLFP